VASVEPYLVRWSDITLAHGGEHIRIDGIGFTAIGRLHLLQLLQAQAASVGVAPRYETALADLDAFSGFDLVIGADGVNSLVRRSHAAAFGASVSYLSNRFAWFGTRKPFDTLTQTFRRSPMGAFNAHHYRYSAEMSTFIVEVDEGTFTDGRLAGMGEAEIRRLCEATFSETLDGWPLVSNRSVWRQFPQVRNERWHHRNMVLVGDALHTAHFSIGAGTRLALEDAIALVRALDEHRHGRHLQSQVVHLRSRGAGARGIRELEGRHRPRDRRGSGLHRGVASPTRRRPSGQALRLRRLRHRRLRQRARRDDQRALRWVAGISPRGRVRRHAFVVCSWGDAAYSHVMRHGGSRQISAESKPGCENRPGGDAPVLWRGVT
jgi:2-polyprenyl-6-methoxyphenol hydroxylase-like FAD-dependent oxidoreductase